MDFRRSNFALFSFLFSLFSAGMDFRSGERRAVVSRRGLQLPVSEVPRSDSENGDSALEPADPDSSWESASCTTTVTSSSLARWKGRRKRDALLGRPLRPGEPGEPKEKDLLDAIAERETENWLR
ncbi:hypothetical protein QBC34DRAFT_392294 [Podospora aff. communis PSN243]|uniref:Uncharacterized protein n=1 Tax=Podospora aff. communis PSN243 TaxID=3040156 RepID=A0AAV9H3W9_9PEZI|nr:hypothetical protein QBC34DRAFT_392294 [Podospora aff. communis PSN243]